MDGPKISVVIPSALKAAPNGELWLTHALRSVAAQTLRPCEVLVGVDPGGALQDHFVRLVSADPLDVWPIKVRVVEAAVKGHQAATNAACKQARGDMIAMLEDDDKHTERHLETMVSEMNAEGADLVSQSQQQIDPVGNLLDVFHFPTASGWLVRRGTWLAVGGFDPRWHIHHDNEWLNRLTASGAKRLHLVPDGTDLSHPWLRHLSQYTKVKAVSGLPSCTVLRTVHEGSILAGCHQDQDKANRSSDEYAALRFLYGYIGW